MSKEINITPLQARYLEDDYIIPESTSRRFLYTAVCIGNLVALIAGITIGWTSPVIPKLANPKNLDQNPFGETITQNEESWLASIFGVGALLGTFAAGYATDNIGRKKTLIFCAGLPSLIGYLMFAFGHHITIYYIGRIFTSFTVGAVFTVLPNFNSEIAKDSNRGAVSSSINIFTNSGPLIAYIAGPYLSLTWFSIICALIPGTFIVAFYLFVPESPYYLVVRNNFVGAMESLKKLRSSNEEGVKEELDTMKLSVEESITHNNVSFKDIYKSKALVKSLTISLTLAAFQQFCGMTIVLFYNQTIFEATRTSLSPEISSIIIGFVQFIASFGAPLFVDRMGRKPLLLVSAIGMLVSEFALGLCFFLKDSGRTIDTIYWLPVLCLVFFVVSYNIGFGPLPWTIMAEIFPPNVKAVGSAVTATICWLSGFIVSKYFFSIAEVITMAGSFWILSGFCGLAVPFVSLYVIETKGKSFTEIQVALAK